MRDIYRRNISRKQLHGIIKEHHKWLTTGGMEGEQANLRGCSLVEVDLRRAELPKAILEGSDFKKALFMHANLTMAILSVCNCQKADFTQANLQEANLFSSDFSEAILIGVRLSGANLKDVNFHETDINNADLRNANLSGVKGLTLEQLNSAIINDKTILPEYLRKN